MPTVRFNLKRPDGVQSAIVAVIRYKGAKTVVFPGISVEVSDWDKKRERSKTNTTLNMQLDQIRKSALEFMSKFMQLPGKSDIMPKPAEYPKLVIEDAILKRGQEMYNLRQSKHTRRHYITCSRRIAMFIKEQNRKEVYIEDIQPEFISAYIGWLSDCGLVAGSVAKMGQIIMLVLKRFGKQEQWRGVRMPKAIYTDQIYLTTSEIEMLENAELEGSDSYIRDLFLAAYYTALRSCDWKQIRVGQIENINGVQMLRVVQQKTKKRILIPASPKLIKILSKHGGNIKQAVNQFFNRQIKEVCKKAGITDTVTVVEHRKGKPEPKEYKKYELVSSHTARRSFATNAVLAGIPATDVMRFTGHSTISAFMVYVRTTEEETATQYHNHPFFKTNTPSTPTPPEQAQAPDPQPPE